MKYSFLLFCLALLLACRADAQTVPAISPDSSIEDFVTVEVDPALLSRPLEDLLPKDFQHPSMSVLVLVGLDSSTSKPQIFPRNIDPEIQKVVLAATKSLRYSPAKHRIPGQADLQPLPFYQQIPLNGVTLFLANSRWKTPVFAL